MTVRAWKVLETTRPRRYVRVDTCELPNGRIIEKLVLDFSTWATIVALTKNQEVLLVRQYRHGVGKIIYELPGGVVEAGESPLHGASRELREETGYTTDNIIETGAISPNPDNHSNTLHTFLALDVEKAGPQALDANEEMDICLVPLDEAIRMTQNGQLIHAMQISALFFALLELKRLH